MVNSSVDLVFNNFALPTLSKLKKKIIGLHADAPWKQDCIAAAK